MGLACRTVGSVLGLVCLNCYGEIQIERPSAWVLITGPVETGAGCSVRAQLADLSQRGGQQAEAWGTVLSTTATLHWNGLCKEGVSSPSWKV